MRTSFARPCAPGCARRPSSIRTRLRRRADVSASATSAAVCASIGATGENSSSWKRCQAGALLRAAPRARRRRGSGAYIAARRTLRDRHLAAAAIASIITPASAPWRSSPTSRRSQELLLVRPWRVPGARAGIALVWRQSRSRAARRYSRADGPLRRSTSWGWRRPRRSWPHVTVSSRYRCVLAAAPPTGTERRFRFRAARASEYKPQARSPC